jgi:hypothetical protein
MTLFEEARLAALGCLAILRGDKNAPAWFDLTLRGLAGSLIALVVIFGASILIPVPNDTGDPTLGPLAQLIFICAVAAIWVTVLYFFLRSVGRSNRLIPFLTINNWGSFYASVITLALGMVGFGGIFLLSIAWAASVYFLFRAALIVLEIRPLLVVALFAAQIVAGLFALMLLGVLLPPPQTV